MSTSGPPPGTEAVQGAPAPSGTSSPQASLPARQTTPPITGGQRASAILAGLAGHILFAIGWFGIAFIVLGAAIAPLISELLANLLGDVDAQRFTEILARASALFWLLGLVFVVGSIAFAVFGIMSSLLILRRGGVDKPGRVNWISFVIAAVLDLPVFLLVVWLATVVTDASPGMLWVPPVLALVLSAAIGVVIWWFMAYANRGSSDERGGATAARGRSQKRS